MNVVAVDDSIEPQTFALQSAVVLSAPTRVTLQCQSPGTSYARHVTFTAIKVGALHTS